MSDLLVLGAAEIATLAGGMRRGASQDEPRSLVGDPGGPDAARGPALAIVEGRVAAVGRREDVERVVARLGRDPARIPVLDATGRLVTPGLIDPHTHLLFAGTREREVRARQEGAGYLEILAAGGGILSTVRATRAATDHELLDHGRRWLSEMTRHGTTTVETKSGYGLDTATELRLLALAGRLGDEGPLEVVPTFLGAHAVAPEFAGRSDAADAYVAHVVEEQLPAVARQGIARSCDVFCEEGVFSAAQSRRVLEAAQAHALDVRLHADELRPSGGAELAAELGARSADHLATPSEAGVDALAAAGERGTPVVATLLPATTLFLGKGRHAPARALIDRGVPVALGTDFNPGTSPTSSLPLVMSLAVVQLGLRAAEALAAVTINAAAALGLEGTHGSLEVGKQGDLVVWDVPRHDLLPYWLGAELAATVVKRGRVIHERPGRGGGAR